ncbi:MAG: NAD(P)/FAD-dependent oxidoreductase [Robiginitomaculum sp.]|nr:NAD(P)/FAD-dependent oxidoreductase [Robiginitomaculum sp.]
MKIDVAIIGLGPAGASAAIIAARAGLSVQAFEKKAVAGHPVQCAEFVPAMLDAGELVMSENSVQRIHEMITFVESDTPDLTKNFSGHMIDRRAFDAALVDKAVAAGAQCAFGVKLKSVSEDGVLTFSDGQVVQAKVIIGADGPHSMVGKAIGSVNTDILETRQLSTTLNVPHVATDIYLSNEFPGGYGWMFPKGDIANIGIGVYPEQKHLLKPALESLHERIAATGQVGTEIIGYTGGIIPVGGMLKADGKLGDSLVLLAGDAAGLTNPITGAGIAAAVMSGRLAGEALVGYLAGEADAIDIYAEDLEDLFGASLARAVLRRKQLIEQGAPERTLSKAALRGGWIAYEDYWRKDAA